MEKRKREEERKGWIITKCGPRNRVVSESEAEDVCERHCRVKGEKNELEKLWLQKWLSGISYCISCFEQVNPLNKRDEWIRKTTTEVPAPSRWAGGLAQSWDTFSKNWFSRGYKKGNRGAGRSRLAPTDSREHRQSGKSHFEILEAE